MAAVVACGGAVLGLFTYMQKQVLTDPECVAIPTTTKTNSESTTGSTTAGSTTTNVLPVKKKKAKLSAGESWKLLANSPYIRDLAILVICYGTI